MQALKVRPSDIWVVSFPKCGTTLTQELVWQVAHGLDLEGGKVELMQRFPFLEGDTLRDNADNVTLPSLETAPAQDQRFIKTHLPLSLLPPDLLTTAKVVYVARNPKDTMVSSYHHYKLFKSISFTGDLKSFSKRFMKGQVMHGPYFPHLEEGWRLRNHPNMLFLFYEDIIRDMKSCVEKVCMFLGKELTECKMDQLLEHLDIKKFRHNPAVNMETLRPSGRFNDEEGSFIRKGEVGGWREEFGDHVGLETVFDDWIGENMREFSIQFPNY